jgi:hypothetical protein
VTEDGAQRPSSGRPCHLLVWYGPIISSLAGGGGTYLHPVGCWRGGQLYTSTKNEPTGPRF